MFKLSSSSHRPSQSPWDKYINKDIILLYLSHCLYKTICLGIVAILWVCYEDQMHHAWYYNQENLGKQNYLLQKRKLFATKVFHLLCDAFFFRKKVLIAMYLKPLPLGSSMQHVQHFLDDKNDKNTSLQYKNKGVVSLLYRRA